MDLSPPLEARPPQRPTAKGHPNQEKRRTPSVKPVSHYKEMYRTLLEGVWLSEIGSIFPMNIYIQVKFSRSHTLQATCGTLNFTPNSHFGKYAKTQKQHNFTFQSTTFPFLSPRFSSNRARGTLVPRPRYTDNLRHRNGFFPFQFRLDPYSFRCAAFSFRRGTFPFRIGT